MNQTKDPSHWLDPDSDVPEALRKLLLAQDCEPSEARLNHFASRLSGVLGTSVGLGLSTSYETAAGFSPTAQAPTPWAGQSAPPPALGSGTSTLQASAGAGKALSVGSWTAGNWVIASAVTGASLLAGVALVREVVKPANKPEIVNHAAAPAESAPAARTLEPPAPPSETQLAARAVPAETAGPAVNEPAAKAIAGGRRAARSDTPAPAKDQEAELLAAAQRALAQGRAELALELTRQHQALPRPMLVQERERLAIEALLRSGRSAAAKERAARFRRNFPNSGYLPRIDSLFSPEERNPKP